MRWTYCFAFSVAAAFLFGCASDTLPTASPASRTVLTGPYAAIVLPSPPNVPAAAGCGFATAINASGEVAGTTCLGGLSLPLAWSATGHAVTLLKSNLLPTTITGISDNGTIVGYDSWFLFEVSEALEWKNDTFHAVDKDNEGPLSSNESTFARFICATDCTIVGSFQSAPESVAPGETEGAIWTRGLRVEVPPPTGSFGAEFVAIGGGFIFGNLFDNNGSPEPARWGARGWERLPVPTDASAFNSFVTSVNVRGVAVGAINRSGAVFTEGVMWPLSGAPVILPPPDGYSAFVPLGINASGLVVGYLVGSSPPFTTAAVYWTSQAGFRLLPNGGGGKAAAVNDRGEIVGFSAGDGINSGTPMFWEPAPAS